MQLDANSDGLATGSTGLESKAKGDSLVTSSTSLERRRVAAGCLVKANISGRVDVPCSDEMFTGLRAPNHKKKFFVKTISGDTISLHVLDTELVKEIKGWLIERQLLVCRSVVFISADLGANLLRHFTIRLC